MSVKWISVKTMSLYISVGDNIHMNDMNEMNENKRVRKQRVYHLKIVERVVSIRLGCPICSSSKIGTDFVGQVIFIAQFQQV